MAVKLRALVGSRVSVRRTNRRHKSSNKVSHLAQHEIGHRKAAELGATVVATFEDLDVSATVSPFERPDLAGWLDIEQRGLEWDVIIWASLDRGFRSPRDAMLLADWCEKHNKMLVLAEQGIVLDYRPEADPIARMLAEMFMLIGSMFAKWELNTHTDRALNAHSILREIDRWAGGPAPEGFDIVPHRSGKGSGLSTSPERKALLHKMAWRLMGCECEDRAACDCGADGNPEGGSFNGITIWLTENGYLTNVDRHRHPDERRLNGWHVGDVIKALTSPATQGVKLSGEQPVIGEDGMPVQMAPPTFTDEMWAKLQIAVERQRRGKSNGNHGPNPLLGVCYCGQCEASATHFVAERVTKASPEGVTYRYYRCARRPKSCPKVGMKAADVESILEEEFLEQCGDLPVMKRIFVPGEDHTDKLNKVKASISRLERESDMGLITTPEDEDRYFARMKALVDSKSHLQTLPQREARWEYVATEYTYGQAWSETQGNVPARRKLLVDAGVRFIIHSSESWEVQVPEDVTTRLSAIKYDKGRLVDDLKSV